MNGYWDSYWPAVYIYCSKIRLRVIPHEPFQGASWVSRDHHRLFHPFLGLPRVQAQTMGRNAPRADRLLLGNGVAVSSSPSFIV